MGEMKHTQGNLESVGATRLWIRDGGAIAIICEPECDDSGDFVEVEIDSERWDEAMANMERLRMTWNRHQQLVDALQPIVDCYGCGESPEKFVAHVDEFLLAARRLLAEIEAEMEGKQ